MTPRSMKAPARFAALRVHPARSMLSFISIVEDYIPVGPVRKVCEKLPVGADLGQRANRQHPFAENSTAAPRQPAVPRTGVWQNKRAIRCSSLPPLAQFAQLCGYRLHDCPTGHTRQHHLSEHATHHPPQVNSSGRLRSAGCNAHSKAVPNRDQPLVLQSAIDGSNAASVVTRSIT